MKVINIIGHSCSGKTTFISKLVVELKELGPVATIKHLGHHNYNLEKGKDTTVFFERGVNISAGIDSEKTVLAIRDNDLASILDLLADQCIEFTVIEGFKTMGLPAIVIGDLESDKVLFRDPALDEVMNGLDQFPDYDTLKGIEAGLRKASLKAKVCPLPCIQKSIDPAAKFGQDAPTLHIQPIPDQSSMGFVMTVSIPATLTEQQYSSGYKTFHKIVTGISGEISHDYYPVQVAVGIRNCWNFSIRCEFLIAVAAEDFETASIVISAVHEQIKRKIVLVGN